MVFFFKFKRHNSELNLYYIHVSKSRMCETVGEIWSKVNHDGMTEGRIDGTGNKTNALKLFSLVLNMDLKTYTKLSLLSIKVVQGVMCAQIVKFAGCLMYEHNCDRPKPTPKTRIETHYRMLKTYTVGCVTLLYLVFLTWNILFILAHMIFYKKG